MRKASLGYLDVGVECPFTVTYKNIKYTRSVFPGGEVHFRLDDSVPSTVVIGLAARSSDDVMLLLMATDALRRAGARHITLYIPYLPYARQDRVCNKGESLSIKVFADLINSQNYDQVVVVDPHSDVSGALINRLYIVDNEQFVTAAMHKLVYDGDVNIKNVIFVAPDAGSTKKVHSLVKKMRERFDDGIGYVQAEKIRDLSTSRIIHTKVNAGRDEVEGRTCIIADDICDGGRTFIELAAELRKMGASKVILLVTHGIFSKNLDVFIDSIDYVISSNSLPAIEPNTTNVKYDRRSIFIEANLS